MQTKNDVSWAAEHAAIEDAVLAHAPSASAAFFCWLEYKQYISGPLNMLQIARCAYENGRVTIVAASVHDPRGRRRIGHAGRFQNRQRVHVGAKSNCLRVFRRSGRGGKVAEDPSSARQTCDVLYSGGRQLLHYALSGSVLLVHQLGMLVQISPKFGRIFGFGGKFRLPINGYHAQSLRNLRGPILGMFIHHD